MSALVFLAMVSHQANAYVVTVSARLAAPPERVYSVIADYQHSHPRILPKQFTGLTVEKGGVGEGTVIRVSMRVFGRRFEFRGSSRSRNRGTCWSKGTSARANR